MAVLFGAANPYARLVREQLDAAGIAANGTPVRTVGDMLAGRVLRGLLTLPDRRFRRSEVLAVLSSAKVVDADGRPAPVRVWERVSRAAGVVEGDDWADRLAAFADERVRRAAAADDDERPSLARRFRHEAERAGSLASFVAALMTDLASGDALGTWHEMARWSSGLLDRYVGDDHSGWPGPEREAADRVGAALDRLAGLDALGGPPPTIQAFRRLLDGELDVALQRIGRLGEGVLVGPLSLAVGLTLDRVVVLGLAEGTFPDRRLDDSLLPDRERVVTSGQLALRAEHTHDDHRHLLAALAAGPATVCFPRGDLRQPGERTASRWLLDDASALAGLPSRVFTADLHAHRGASWLDVVPSFTAGVGRLTFPATSQEHRLADLLRGEGPLSARTVAHVDPILAAGAALAEARRSHLFTRFDGNLAGLDLVPVVDGDRAHSATRLQAWATCPHGYLLEHVLGVETVDEPERRLRLDPLDKGALIHEVLHRFIDEGARDPDRIRAIGDEVCDEFAARGRTGRQLFWRRDRARILADLERFFTNDATWRAGSGAESVAAEHRFDTVLPLPDGGALRVRGAIDRVDRLPDECLVVFDYKTGKPDRYRDLSEAEPHQRGTRLQPVIYAAGARDSFGGGPARFEYWFVTTTGSFLRIGYDVTDAVAAEVGAALGTIVDGISRGLFPRRPPEVPAWNRVDCWFCSPDGLSAAEARRDWERKRDDALLTAYRDLCEPEGDDEHG
jgi:RecB family exonuclease